MLLKETGPHFLPSLPEENNNKNEYSKYDTRSPIVRKVKMKILEDPK